MAHNGLLIDCCVFFWFLVWHGLGHILTFVSQFQWLIPKPVNGLFLQPPSTTYLDTLVTQPYFPFEWNDLKLLLLFMFCWVLLSVLVAMANNTRLFKRFKLELLFLHIKRHPLMWFTIWLECLLGTSWWGVLDLSYQEEAPGQNQNIMVGLKLEGLKSGWLTAHNTGRKCHCRISRALFLPS